MGLKSRNWFFGKCLVEERKRTKLTYLSAKALDLGLTGNENTQSHIMHACGAVQEFLMKYPTHKRTIKIAPAEAYKPGGKLLRDWLRYFSTKSDGYGRHSFCYDWDTLKSCLTKKYGGRCTGGGGGNNEFEIVLRLMAEFI
jgi:hypothetical protein